ncbi:ABC transporter ATP-binding protein [Bombiscardovia apis]|uniref:ABC transporter ATP-binding protein n=1 Tax=Bombiscardovia apis TaxID=2932182 RepID=A0ABN6SK96_9BIFI|nr:ABC transporter ATP-binding protein [Bombiscardovia apis]BDR55105.1 ABC transporter ATP-binding protein [Bombiscardovia apis]
MLNINDFSFTYSGQLDPALNHVSLRVRPGEAVVVTGKSGCGKTTLSRAVNGLIPELYEGQEEGSCQVAGLEAGAVPIFQLSEQVGSVFQNPKTQFFTTDVTSELAFPLENMGLGREQIAQRLSEVADLFGISHLLDRSMFALSGGEKQMVAIASSYMLNPKMLLLDEPSSNLDSESIEMLTQVLAKLKGQGLSLLIIEHRLYYLNQIADRFVLVDRGQVAGEYSPSQLGQMGLQERERLGLRAVTKAQEGQRQPELEANQTGGSAGEVSLHIESLAYSYKGCDQPALQVDTLDVNNREVIGIVGHNGAGKSTFAKVLTGLIAADKGGRVELQGQQLSPKDLTRESFLVFQDVNYQLFSESVAKELQLGAPRTSSERLGELAEGLGLTDLLERSPSTLSGGQKQRVAVGCAVLSGKRIVIMDEPTSGLDLAHMHQVTQAIDYLHALGAIVLVISHDREFLLQTCTRFVTFDQGHIVADEYHLD